MPAAVAAGPADRDRRERRRLVWPLGQGRGRAQPSRRRLLLESGQDLAIGFSHHDAEAVHLYLEQSFSFFRRNAGGSDAAQFLSGVGLASAAVLLGRGCVWVRRGCVWVRLGLRLGVGLRGGRLEVEHLDFGQDARLVAIGDPL